MKTAALISVVLLAGCSKPPECTLATPLVPGVPGSPGHLLPSERNPNGDSELAALMRRFVEDWKAASKAMDQQKSVNREHWAVHARMRCAWPTVPADRDQTFDGLAVGYLEAVKAFDQAPSDQTYDNVIGACAACHEVTCGGPMQVIEKLRRSPAP